MRGLDRELVASYFEWNADGLRSGSASSTCTDAEDESSGIAERFLSSPVSRLPVQIASWLQYGEGVIRKQEFQALGFMLKTIQISDGGHSIYHVRIRVTTRVRRAVQREEVGKERNHERDIRWYRVSNTDTCLEDRYVIKEGIRTPS